MVESILEEGRRGHRFAAAGVPRKGIAHGCESVVATAEIGSDVSRETAVRNMLLKVGGDREAALESCRSKCRVASFALARRRRVAPILLVPTMASTKTQALDYTALEKVAVLPPVDRVGYVTSLARGKRVIDLGALDETAYEVKASTRNWLHKEMALVAAEVVGIDNSPLVPPEGLEVSGSGGIFPGDIFDLAPVLERHGWPDILVAGELVEHLPDTLTFLKNLKRDCSAGDPLVVITTPNACSVHNGILGAFRMESMHKDHLQIYSYKTLCTLFGRAGFREWTIRPYHARFTEMIEGSTGAKRLTARVFEKLVNFLERRFPLLGCGWVCEVRL